MAMTERQISDENKYLGHHLLFKLENQRSFNYQNYKGKNNYETNASSRAIEYTSGTIAETEKCKIFHIMKFELDLYVISLTTSPNTYFKIINFSNMFLYLNTVIVTAGTFKP